jgi:hypothetical protein
LATEQRPATRGRGRERITIVIPIALTPRMMMMPTGSIILLGVV